MLHDSMQFIAGADQRYDISLGTLTTPSDDDILLRFKATRPFRLPANLSGSVAEAETPPSGTVSFKVYKGVGSPLTEVGSFDIDTNGEITSAATPGGAVQDFAIGDQVTIHIDGNANSIDEVFVTLKTVGV